MDHGPFGTEHVNARQTVMADVIVKNDQTDGTHDVGILDGRIKLDSKVQTRTPITKDPSPEVFWAGFNYVFAVCKFQAINIA